MRATLWTIWLSVGDASTPKSSIEIREGDVTHLHRLSSDRGRTAVVPGTLLLLLRMAWNCRVLLGNTCAMQLQGIYSLRVRCWVSRKNRERDYAKSCYAYTHLVFAAQLL